MGDGHCARNLSSSLYYFVGVPAATILELFGGMFFDFCQESGYGSILQVLGATTRDFLNNLDTLHDHLQVGWLGAGRGSSRSSREWEALEGAEGARIRGREKGQGVGGAGSRGDREQWMGAGSRGREQGPGGECREHGKVCDRGEAWQGFFVQFLNFL